MMVGYLKLPIFHGFSTPPRSLQSWCLHQRRQQLAIAQRSLQGGANAQRLAIGRQKLQETWRIEKWIMIIGS